MLIRKQSAYGLEQLVELYAVSNVRHYDPPTPTS